jgi:predicted aspartyl protease
MGLTVIDVEVASPARPRRRRTIEFLVDSGAIYSVVPAKVLRGLGIRPVCSEEFRLADGTKVVRKKGVALFRLGERVGGADVIFGEPGDSPLLGALTLGALGLFLDPIKRVLRPLPMILGTHAAAAPEHRCWIRAHSPVHRASLFEPGASSPRRSAARCVAFIDDDANRESRPPGA